MHKKMKCWDQTTTLLLTAHHETYPAAAAEVMTRLCLPAMAWIPQKCWLFFLSMLKAQPSSGRGPWSSL